jgi:hypothetical protein
VDRNQSSLSFKWYDECRSTIHFHMIMTLTNIYLFYLQQAHHISMSTTCEVWPWLHGYMEGLCQQASWPWVICFHCHPVTYCPVKCSYYGVHYLDHDLVDHYGSVLRSRRLVCQLALVMPRTWIFKSGLQRHYHGPGLTEYFMIAFRERLVCGNSWGGLYRDGKLQ